jgi:hypothetical protein
LIRFALEAKPMTPDDRNQDSPPTASSGVDDSAEIASQVAQSLRGLRFGQVTITVHDGMVVQIERLERTRLRRCSI